MACGKNSLSRLPQSALGLMLSACSLAGPNPRAFTTAAERSRGGAGCHSDRTGLSRHGKSELRQKGIKSVLAILSSMRPGAVDEDYVKRMRNKGYTVEK